MAKLRLPQDCSFEGWDRLLGPLQSVRIGNNTYAERLTSGEVRSIAPLHFSATYETAGIGVRLHRTHVVVFCEDGSILLDSGGWQTYTTKERMNAVLPRGIRVHQAWGQWFVRNSHSAAGGPTDVRFEDGMTVRDYAR